MFMHTRLDKTERSQLLACSEIVKLDEMFEKLNHSQRRFDEKNWIL